MDLFDIVFEKRNKEYGAYDLRKKYVRYLAISFSITLFAVLFFAGYTIAYKFYNITSVPIPKGVIYEPTYLSEELIIPPDVPDQLPEQAPDESDLNETPIVSDSLKSKPKEEAAPPKEEKKEEQDSSSSGGNLGAADGTITVPIERMPEFPGGESARVAFIQHNIRTDVLSKVKRVRGVVIISFVVRRDGRVDDIKVVHSLNPEIDQECVRVVSSMPLWKPAISGGRPIEITHTLPFTFAF